MSIVILGAGLAGLSAAYHLKGIDYEIFEAEKEAGGLCRSVCEDGFVFDYGPHFFFSKDKYFNNFLKEIISDNFHELRSLAGQYSFNCYLRFPYIVNLYGAPIEVIKECVLGFVDARNSKKRNRPKNYYEWCLYNYGKGYAYRFMFPYAKKIWTVNSKRLTTDWIGKRIVMPTLEQILEGALHRSDHQLNYIKTFRYPVSGGMSAVISELIKRVKPIHFNKRVVRIDIKKKVLHFQDNTSISYDYIISTIPLPDIIKIMPDAPATIKKASMRLIHNSVFIINIGIDRHIDSEFQWIYFDGDEPFYRIHFPSKLSLNNAPRGTGSISVEIAYSNFRPLRKEGLYSTVVSKLKEARILRETDRIIHKSSVNLKYAYVIYDHNRKADVRRIREFLRNHGIETCGRFGEWAYLWMDQSFHSGKNAAESILRRI